MKIEEMSDKEFVKTLRKCAVGYDCSSCEHWGEDCNLTKMMEDAADRIEELTETVEQKANVSQETHKNPGEKPKSEPTKATEYITLPLEEYAYLRNLDVLMDILLGDGDYSTFRNVVAVRQSIRDMKEKRKVAAQA